MCLKLKVPTAMIVASLMLSPVVLLIYEAVRGPELLEDPIISNKVINN